MASTPPRLVYLSMEIALESDIPTYSGGLGVLAGDTIRAAADLDLPMAAVSLVHRLGYFRQTLDAEGLQHEAPDPWDPSERCDPVDASVSVKVSGRAVRLRAWRYRVRGARGGVVPVYLLDADVEGNAEEDRHLTDHLYGGDARYRLSQETLLGYGAVALMEALGHSRIHTWHMNEGHCALAPLALVEERVGEGGLAAATRRQDGAVRRRCVFTTHTPVPAGHDRFPAALVASVLGQDRAKALATRGSEPGQVLNMTALGLHFARFVNGVSMRHALLSREMFPGRAIHAITNGVHTGTWTAPSLATLFDRHVPEWRVDPLNLRHAVALPLEGIREAHAGAKAALIKTVREATGASLDPDVFTLGFARRAATYKRADLLLADPERLRALAHMFGGLQVVYAGKAHPADGGGKDLIRRVHAMAEALEGDATVVFVPGYDMRLGGILTAGVDVWLNNPEKPKEASGTSGMKAALNGVPNLSVLDGWWIEGHVEGVTGWAIGGDWREASDPAGEAVSIYAKLEAEILPLYHEDPAGFDQVRRNAIMLNGPHFSARRMMHQYVELAYGGWEGMVRSVKTRRPVGAGMP